MCVANSFLTDNYIEAYYKLKLISSPQQTLRWLGTGSRLRTQQAANDTLQMNNALQPFAEMCLIWYRSLRRKTETNCFTSVDISV